MYATQNEDNVQVCLECGDVLEYGRSNKKFCCDACKNKYHNRQVRQSRHYKQMINMALEKNYVILDTLRRTSLRNIQMIDMQNMGFAREYFTSYKKSRAEETFMCYDIRYSVVGGVLSSITKVSIQKEEV